MEEETAKVENAPKTRTVYIGVYVTNDGALASTGHPTDNKKQCEHNLFMASRFSKSWKKMISFEVPYFEIPEKEDEY